MTRVLSDIAGLLANVVPPWAFPPAVALLLVVAAPIWLRMVRGRQVGGLVRRMVRADPTERERLGDEVLGLAGTRDGLLLIAAEQAHRYDQRVFRDRVLAVLEARGAVPQDVARLRGKLAVAAPPVGHPLEIAANVERLLEQGLRDRARERLRAGRSRYPDDPDLSALEQRLDAEGP